MKNAKKITEKNDGILIQQLLFDLKTCTDFTYETIAAYLNKIFLYYDIKPRSRTTIERWCNKIHIPPKCYHKYIIMFIREYAPDLLKTEPGSYFTTLYLTDLPTSRLPFSMIDSTSNPVTIKYEITESMYKLLKVYPTNLELYPEYNSLYYLLIDFYIQLIEENEILYITFGHIKYKVILPDSIRDLFYRALKFHTLNSFLVHMVNLYFINLYFTLYNSFLRIIECNTFIDKELLNELFSILNYTDVKEDSYPDFEIKMHLVKTNTKNIENKFLEKLLQGCINAGFNAEIASECLSYYKKHLS